MATPSQKKRVVLMVDVDAHDDDTELHDLLRGLVGGGFDEGDSVSVEIGDYGLNGDLVMATVIDPEDPPIEVAFLLAQVKRAVEILRGVEDESVHRRLRGAIWHALNVLEPLTRPMDAVDVEDLVGRALVGIKECTDSEMWGELPMGVRVVLREAYAALVASRGVVHEPLAT